jgi:hypothetical protein
MVNVIGHSNEERFAEVTSAQTCQRESIEKMEAIVRDELKKMKMETRAAPASGPRPLHFPLSSDPLQGIIAFLTKKCGGNVIDKGIVKILTGKAAVTRADRQSRNVADLRDTSTGFLSIASPGRWTCVDEHKKADVLFTLSQSVRGRCVRIRQTGVNSIGNH